MPHNTITSNKLCSQTKILLFMLAFFQQSAEQPHHFKYFHQTFSGYNLSVTINFSTTASVGIGALNL